MTISSDTVTEGIRVQVYPKFVPEQSHPDKNIYFFAYHVIITNNGEKLVQLVSRYWQIINAEGEKEVVTGKGVVGESPELKPGEKFEYTSYCPLNTEWGTMEGTYHMITESGTMIDVHIGRFYLCDIQLVED
jgi:ApaG protein